MSDASRRAERSAFGGVVVATTVTLLVHAFLVTVIGTLAADSFALRHEADRDVDVVLADMPEREPPAALPTIAAPPIEPAADNTAEAIAARLSERLTAPPPATGTAIADRLRDRLATGEAPTVGGAPLAGAGPAATVTFVGVEADRAASVAYVVDASGSLIGTLPIVIDELERSLQGLSPAQRFGVVFFQRNGALTPPGGDTLRSADPKAIRETIDWAREDVRPAGRSNPLAALDKALRWQPDVVFLLSTSITGSGEFEISKGDLLARLDALNPPADAFGVRRSRIRCIQFLDPDPQQTLREIADRHGGKNGYRYLSREALGLRRR